MQRKADIARWSIRLLFVGLLVWLAFLPEPESSLFIYPKTNDLGVLGVICLVFLLPFVELSRRSLVMALDFVALASFIGVLALYEPRRPGLMLLVYLPLAYLVVRMVRIGRIGRRGQAEPVAGEDRVGGAPAGPLRALTPRWMALGVLALVGIHVSWALAGGTFSDEGYAGVHGALQIVNGEPLYGVAGRVLALVGYDPHFDTYPPFNYEAYIPFALAAGAHNAFGQVSAFHVYQPFASAATARTAAQVATLCFDLLTAAFLFELGRRARGMALALGLAYAWLAFPLLFYDDVFSFNDALVAATLAATLLVARSNPGRGATAALAAWCKLSPLALVPLLAGHRAAGASRSRALLEFAGAFAVVSLLVFIPLLSGGGAHVFHRTVGYQIERGSAFSAWSLAHEGFFGAGTAVSDLADVLHGLLFAIVGAFAVALFWAPRRQDVVGLAAAAGAVMLGVVLSLGYFSFSYLVWFAPLVLVAILMAPEGAPKETSHRRRAPARADAAAVS